MAEDRVDVLVVGGGPVGLTMASELLRHGVRARAVDKNEGPQPWSKAAAVSSRTMEVLTTMGLVERALEKGRPVYSSRIRKGNELIGHIDFRGADTTTPYPYIFGLSQRDMELLLAEHLRGLGGTLERKTELVDLSEDGDGVLATLAHDGKTESVRAKWLIACDGSKSTVRKKLQLPFEGSTFEQTLIQADIGIDFPFEVDPHESQMFISEHGPLVALPLLSEGRYRLIVIDVADPPAEPPLSLFEEHAALRGPPGLKLRDPAWTVSFRFHGRIVPSYRHGRVFLAGDAGHIHSPVGGQGMNLGMQDAFNLAWKLALVVKGLGRSEILDSYDAERHPIGQDVVSTTDAATKRMMRMLTLRSSVARAVRDQLIGVVTGSDLFRETVFRMVSGVAVGYPKSPIVAEHHASIWAADIAPGRADERPGLRDWMRFSSGPEPGARVPDADLEGDQGSVHQLLINTKHTLLLFDGAASTPAGYANLTTIAERVRSRYAATVEPLIVVPMAKAPAELKWDGRVVLDAERTLHEHFCCASEGLYLIRPDGYVGFRSQPADEPALLRYLETIFTV